MESRKYTHVVERRYVERGNKRFYFAMDEEVPEKDRPNLIYSRFAFTLNPLLVDDFLKDLTLEDQMKIVKAANPINLWRLALCNDIDFPVTAVKPCTAGTEMVEVASKTNILKRLTEIWKKKTITAEQNKCVVVNDVTIPTLPVYRFSNDEMLEILKHWFQHTANSKNWSYLTCMQQKTIDHAYRWKLRTESAKPIDILPSYNGLVQRVIWIEPGKQKKVNLLQIEVAILKSEYNSVFGKPPCDRLAPFEYTSFLDGTVYNGTWESFYLYSPDLKGLLSQGRRQKTTAATASTATAETKKEVILAAPMSAEPTVVVTETVVEEKEEEEIVKEAVTKPKAPRKRKATNEKPETTTSTRRTRHNK
jgi:hypothetical protein